MKFLDYRYQILSKVIYSTSLSTSSLKKSCVSVNIYMCVCVCVRSNLMALLRSKGLVLGIGGTYTENDLQTMMDWDSERQGVSKDVIMEDRNSI